MNPATLEKLNIIATKTKKLRDDSVELTILIDSVKDDVATQPKLKSLLDTHRYILQLLQNWIC